MDSERNLRGGGASFLFHTVVLVVQWVLRHSCIADRLPVVVRFFFWRQGASSDDREDCYGRATVALARAIRHTYIVSPLDMAGMIGMAQTLVVYHYGYHTLKARQILFFGPSPLPFGGSTVLETYSSTTSRSLPRTRGESIRG